LGFTIDENREPLHRTLTTLGVALGVNRKHSKMAAQEALVAMNIRRRAFTNNAARDDRPRILLLSHPYILHDDYLMGPIRRKLEEMNINVFTRPFPESDQAPELSAWDTCCKIHQTLIDLDPHEVMGVIHLSSFNCGCDSIMTEFFRELLQEKATPYMVLIMDEHSAQGGLETRLEAFVDSMGW
jgi:predicted nucleotide-binding protein (sugar kinase/HSP70/actin superfamily)